MQPCVSPVWDTCIAMVALEEAGLPPDHPALVKAAEWLLSKQVLGPGDWQVKDKDAEPGGWAFEFRNDFYPDVDDTAFVENSAAKRDVLSGIWGRCRLTALASGGCEYADHNNCGQSAVCATDWLQGLTRRT